MTYRMASPNASAASFPFMASSIAVLVVGAASVFFFLFLLPFFFLDFVELELPEVLVFPPRNFRSNSNEETSVRGNGMDQGLG